MAPVGGHGDLRAPGARVGVLGEQPRRCQILEKSEEPAVPRRQRKEELAVGAEKRVVGREDEVVHGPSKGALSRPEDLSVSAQRAHLVRDQVAVQRDEREALAVRRERRGESSACVRVRQLRARAGVPGAKLASVGRAADVRADRRRRPRGRVESIGHQDARHEARHDRAAPAAAGQRAGLDPRGHPSRREIHHAIATGAEAHRREPIGRRHYPVGNLLSTRHGAGFDVPADRPIHAVPDPDLSAAAEEHERPRIDEGDVREKLIDRERRIVGTPDGLQRSPRRQPNEARILRKRGSEGLPCLLGERAACGRRRRQGRENGDLRASARDKEHRANQRADRRPPPPPGAHVRLSLSPKWVATQRRRWMTR